MTNFASPLAFTFGVHLGSACRGASVDPCPLYRQKTHKSPKLSKHLHQLEAFWQIWLEQLGLSCLKTEGNVPNFDGLSISFPIESGQTLGHFPQVISYLVRQAVVLKPLNYPLWKSDEIDVSDVGPPEEADGWDMSGISHVMEL